MSDANALAELLAAMRRIEERQGAFDQALRRVMGALDIYNEKLDAILAAAIREPGRSPVAAMLAEILTIRDELAREADGVEMEPAEPGAFDRTDETAALDV